MKKILEYLGLIVLICFSFFYTEKTITIIKENDDLMIEIEKNKENYNYDAINAIIDNDNIIPGVYGKKVNVERSYSNMKKIGLFKESLLIYDIVKPEISIFNNYDKYVISGSNRNKNISIIFAIDDISDLELINKLPDNKYNYFIDTLLLNNNLNDFKKLAIKNELYNYGVDKKYLKDNIIYGNNLINGISNNKSIYCLVEEKNNDILNICANNNMWTIKTNMISNNIYSYVKKNINNGLIIYLNLNKTNIDEIISGIKFINQKGYKIESLSSLLSEN